MRNILFILFFTISHQGIQAQTWLANDQQTKNEVAVQPNPANDHLTVQTAFNNPIRRVQLYDVQGALQLEVQPAETVMVDVDTAQLPAGMYMLLVHSAEGQYAQLVILEKI